MLTINNLSYYSEHKIVYMSLRGARFLACRIKAHSQSLRGG